MHSQDLDNDGDDDDDGDLLVTGEAGTVLPNTPIAVDYFRDTKGIKLFFLTHFHSDHYQGLTDTFYFKTRFATTTTTTTMKTVLAPIYASKITRDLLLSAFPSTPPQLVVTRSSSSMCVHQNLMDSHLMRSREN